MYLLHTFPHFQITKHSQLEGVFIHLHNLKENFEISFAGKIYNFIPLYRSPSQSSDNYEDFAENLELNLDKIARKSQYVLVVHSDFSVDYQIVIKTIKQFMKALKLMQ